MDAINCPNFIKQSRSLSISSGRISRDSDKSDLF